MELCVRSSPYFFSLAVHRTQGTVHTYTHLIIVVVVWFLLLVDVSIEGLNTHIVNNAAGKT